MTDHATAVAHSFEDCADPNCTEVLCKHYRAGLTAGHEFMLDTVAGVVRVPGTAREADDSPEP